jgi:hypothetical protein
VIFYSSHVSKKNLPPYTQIPFDVGPFTSLPCAQDLGGENPYIDTKDVLKLLIVGDSVVRLLIILGARSA